MVSHNHLNPTKAQMLAEIYAYLSGYFGAETQPMNPVKRLTKDQIGAVYSVFALWRNETGERYHTGVETIEAHLRVQLERAAR